MSKNILVKENFVGWAQELTHEQYHSIEGAVNASPLKTLINESPLEYLYETTAGLVEEKKCYDFGTCMHSVVLEQNANRFKAGPSVNKNTNVWKDAKKEAESEGKILLDLEDYSKVLSGFDAFCAHPKAHKLVSQCQKIEVAGFYIDEETGLWCRFKPDGYCANDTEGDFLFNYKTARSIAKRDVDNAILTYGYHISAAHYMAGVKAITGREVQDYFFAFQKSSGSMDTRIIRLSDADRATGERLRREALSLIADCRLKNHWPGVSDIIEDSDIPYYGHDKTSEFLKREVI